MFGAGYSYGPQGQGNLALGWPEKRVSPEGAPRRECHSCGRKKVLAVRSGPFRAFSVGNLTQGKPGLSYRDPSGRREIHAKHMQASPLYPRE